MLVEVVLLVDQLVEMVVVGMVQMVELEHRLVQLILVEEVVVLKIVVAWELLVVQE